MTASRPSLASSCREAWDCVRGGGSLRRRRPGVWEVRVGLGPDPVSGRTRVRSVTVHGDRETAQAARERWAVIAELLRSAGRARPGITLACLLRERLAADHGWRPSTLAGYRSAVGFLARDRIGSTRAIDVGPAVLAAAITAWRADGWTDPTVYGRGSGRCARRWDGLMSSGSWTGTRWRACGGHRSPGCGCTPRSKGPRHP
jgi:hypothetical protein